MEFYFIISNERAESINWKHISAHIPNNEKKLILITTPPSSEQILKKGLGKYFIHVEAFDFSSNVIYEETSIGRNQYNGSCFEQIKNVMQILKQRFIKQEDNFYIVTVNEEAMIDCARLREFFNIPGDKLADILRFINKITMKEHLIKQGVPDKYFPQHTVFDKQLFLSEKEKYAKSIFNICKGNLFIKPAAGCGSQDITVINKFEDFLQWCDTYQNEHALYEIDEYIRGELFHCASIVIDGQVKHAIVSRYLNPCGEALLYNKPLGSMIVDQKESVALKILEFNALIIEKMQIAKSCITHHEIFVRDDETLVFLEIGKRVIGGGNVAEMFRYYTGISFREADYMLRLDIPFDKIINCEFAQPQQYYASVGFLREQSGAIKDIKPINASSPYKYTIIPKIGEAKDKLGNIADDVIAEIMLENKDYLQLKKDFLSLANHRFCSYEPNTNEKVIPGELYFIISSEKSGLINWDNFDIPKHVKVVFIVDEENYPLVKDKIKDRNSFVHIEYIEDDILVRLDETRDSLVQDLLRTLTKLIKVYAVSGETVRIITVNEDLMMLCAQLREKLQIAGDQPQDVLRFTNKKEMKKFLIEHGIPKSHFPRHAFFDNSRFSNEGINYAKELFAELGSNLFIKPINGCGSQGIFKIQAWEEFLSWCTEHASSHIEYEIDEYIKGDLYHCASIVLNGKIQLAVLSKYLNPCGEAILTGNPLGSMIIEQDSELAVKILEFNSAVIESMKLNESCVTHHEIFVNPNNEIIFLEIAKRVIAGGTVAEMFKMQTGINFREADYKLRLGLFSKDNFEKNNTYYACVAFLAQQSGKVSQINSITVSSNYYFTKTCQKEALINKTGDISDDLITEIVLQNPDPKQLKIDFESLKNYKLVEISKISTMADEILVKNQELAVEQKMINAHAFFSPPKFEDTNNLIFKRLQPKDIASTVNCLTKAFTEDEPITREMKITADEFKIFATSICEKAAREQLSIIALDKFTKEVIACRIVEDAALPKQSLPLKISPKFFPIFELLENASSALPHAKQPGIEGHFVVLAVDKGYRGHQLATKLVTLAAVLLKSKGYKYFSAEMTSEASAHAIFKAFTKPYEESCRINYRNFVYGGRLLFGNKGEVIACRNTLSIKPELETWALKQQLLEDNEFVVTKNIINSAND